MIAAQNAYELVGPGLQFDWPWPLVYPATAFAAAMPLAVLPQVHASIIFVFISFVFLGYSVTAEGWHRLPMFASMPLITSAAAGQWSPILTAAIGLPWLAFLFAAKPTDGLAILTLGKRGTLKYALAGALFLGAVSLALFPRWPLVWLQQLPYGKVQMAPPLFRAGGFLILLSLLKWRRPEARFLIVLSFMPAVGAWYTAVPLFLIPKTLKESMTLAMTSSLGWLAQYEFVHASSENELNAKVGTLIVMTCFLPCVAMILRRPNHPPPSPNREVRYRS
jgi:hypothetical protein